MSLTAYGGLQVANTKEVAKRTSAVLDRMRAGFKYYDVFRSRIVHQLGNPNIWWEEFRPVGSVSAYNSVHAMQVAKNMYPAAALRISVIAADHPLSPSNQAKGALQASIAMNKATSFGKVEGNNHGTS
jgi:hypothetical protein